MPARSKKEGPSLPRPGFPHLQHVGSPQPAFERSKLVSIDGRFVAYRALHRIDVEVRSRSIWLVSQILRNERCLRTPAIQYGYQTFDFDH